MKIYKRKPLYLIRANIRKQGEKTQIITFCETTMPELKEKLKEIVKPHINPFEEGKRTSVDIREAEGGNNGRSETISFKGLNVEETAKIILEYFNK